MKWILVDGFNIAFRGFHAMWKTGLARKDGFPTGAIFAWLRFFLRLRKENPESKIVVFFDLGGSARHLKLCPEYKAQRGEAPDDFKRQIPVLKSLCAPLGAQKIEREGVEADDLIGSCAVSLAQRGEEVAIVSADKDLGQIVGGNITQWKPPSGAKGEWRKLDAAGIEAEFGVPPSQIPDYLALIGDTADNIRGIEGVGEKTAVAWLKAHGSLEGILKRWSWLEPKRLRLPVRGGEALLRRNLELVTLLKDLEIPALEPPAFDRQKLADFCAQYELSSILKDLEAHF